MALEGKNINEDFYLDRNYPNATNGDARPFVIDVSKYYPEITNLRVLSVTPEVNEWHQDARPTGDALGIDYLPAYETDLWECHSDTFEYEVVDLDTEEQVTATVTLNGLMPDRDFVAYPIRIGRERSNSRSYQLDMGTFNKYDGVRIIGIGTFNTNLIESVQIDPNNSARLNIEISDSDQWDTDGIEAVFQYRIECTEYPGIVAFSTISVVRNTLSDSAYDVYVQVGSEPPSGTEVNLATEYSNRGLSPDFALSEVFATDDDRGTTSLNTATKIGYTFNLTSGYWDEEEVSDVIGYKWIHNTTGAERTGYLVMHKCVVPK